MNRLLERLHGINRPYATAGWLLIGLGWVAGLLGWIGIQSDARVAVQLAYLGSGGLSGIALVIIGAALLNREDARFTRRLLEELRDRLDEIDGKGEP